MINNVLQVLSLSGLILGILACCILVFSNKTHKHANHLLAISIFCLVIIMLTTFLLEWNVDVYAYIYRFPSPLSYLILPTAYLYIRSVIYDETRLKKFDLIHFLPALLHLIELIPHYFTTYEYRKELARKIIETPDKLIEFDEGLLPPYYHTAFRCLQGLLYIILMINLLQKGSKIKVGELYIRQTNSFKWMKAFTVLIGIISLPMLLIFITPESVFQDKISFLLIVVTLTFLVINLYLFLQPEILYGIPRRQNLALTPAPKSDNNLKMDGPLLEIENRKSEKLNLELNMQRAEFSNLDAYKPVLDSYMSSNKPFLKQKYTINDLSRDTSIPQHHLSALLNRIYKMRFNEYLNGLRINYIIENFDNPSWDKLTLEGIAKQVGFTSRTTFFYTIKKITGQTPSEFIAKIKQRNRES